MKRLKLQWAIGIGIALTVILIISINILLSSNIIERNLIQEAIDVRLERNYKWTYHSLILGHTYMPQNIYKSVRDDYFKEFPNIKIIRLEKLDIFYNEDIKKISNEIIKEIPTEKKIIIDKNRKNLTGIFPVRAELHCLSCHYNVQKNDILALIEINISLNEIYKTIDQSKKILLTVGFLILIFSIFILYQLYYHIAEKKVNILSNLIAKITEGDLTFIIDKNLKERQDIIEKIARDLENLKNYLNNLVTKILDLTLKLTKQIDKVYSSIDLNDSNIKKLSLSFQELEFEIENLFRSLNELNRSMSKFLEISRFIEKSLENIKINYSIPEELERIQENLNTFNNRALNIIDKLEKIIVKEDIHLESIDHIKNIISSFEVLQDNISKFIYETLIISTYLKNTVTIFKTSQFEELKFDIFETDIDRYVLRVESHIKELEKLDPERWGDPMATSLGKWLKSEEYMNLKSQIRDFSFEELENNYYKLIELGKELINSYETKDLRKVEHLIKEFRSTYLFIKGLLEELRFLHNDYVHKEGGNY